VRFAQSVTFPDFTVPTVPFELIGSPLPDATLTDILYYSSSFTGDQYILARFLSPTLPIGGVVYIGAFGSAIQGPGTYDTIALLSSPPYDVNVFGTSTITEIPESRTYTLLGLGLVMLQILRHRRT
jgi:hypothetical protein